MEAYLAGARDEPPLRELPGNSACAWLHSEGQMRYRGQPDFQVVEAQCLQIHDLADRLCTLQAAGNTEEVRARLPELRAARDALLEKLKQLSRTVAS